MDTVDLDTKLIVNVLSPDGQASTHNLVRYNPISVYNLTATNRLSPYLYIYIVP